MMLILSTQVFLNQSLLYNTVLHFIQLKNSLFFVFPPDGRMIRFNFFRGGLISLRSACFLVIRSCSTPSGSALLQKR